ncbi:MAG: hypothetical protein M1541_02175 [Acidobacteria bacterium]|nr:hypothetical protein [Acidobacteriota bacterium]
MLPYKIALPLPVHPRKSVAADLGKYWGPERLIARSVTGELTRDARNGFVEVNTPRTQALIGFLGRTRH